ncbi:MAG: hypothetical protein QM764_08400 [Chitinophagaceae bacterium]
MKYNYWIIFIFSLTSFFCGCKKQQNSDTDQNCAEIQQVKIVAEKNNFTVGDEIHLAVNQLPTIALFIWTQENEPNAISNDEDVDINYAEKKHEGWYYLNVSYPDCASHTDSIYITVKNKPVTAPCTSANNTVSFSSIPDLSPATVSWSYNTTWNRRVLSAHGSAGYPDFNIYFNTYWDTKEPEDGEYSVTTMQATDEYPPYTVYISSLYSSIFFQAGSGKVYVTHENGKLRVTFCDISLSGDSYTTTATGMLTAP